MVRVRDVDREVEVAPVERAAELCCCGVRDPPVGLKLVGPGESESGIREIIVSNDIRNHPANAMNSSQIHNHAVHIRLSIHYVSLISIGFSGYIDAAGQAAGCRRAGKGAGPEL
jgi:hypothetical protein